jgi:glutaminyl-peptide cyclotransferase
MSATAPRKPIAAAIRNPVSDTSTVVDGEDAGDSTPPHRHHWDNVNRRHPSWSARCQHCGVRLRPLIAIVVLTATIAAACAGGSPDLAPAEPTPTSTPGPIRAGDTSLWPEELGPIHRQWTVRVIRVIDHDPEAFTQGLEQTSAGILESTGRRGRSTLRLVDPAGGNVLESQPIDDEFFGEGLTVVDDEIIQLTWTSGVALRYDAETLEPIGSYRYSGEGWGLCFDGESLWMSDGTARLTRRDPGSFVSLGDVEVRRDGDPIENLNELECVDGRVLANIWKSDEIVVIDPESGTVGATIDAASLVAEIDATASGAVLNGIADLGDGTLLLGGKLWPRNFVVELVSADAS